LAACALLFAGASHAVDVPGCAALKEGDFKMTTLATRAGHNLNEPLKMSFDMSEDGKVDIYFIEKAGNLRKFDGATQTVTNLGKINVHVQDEYGLMGIVLDPQFKANHFLYLFYMPNITPYELRVSRFTVTGNQLDMGSEKIMLKNAATVGWHGGGGMAFDSDGNLWVSIGDTRAGQVAAPNTNDLRGKILRIKPKADGTYSIPAGNLFPEGTAKTRPEIYIMGNREPYTLAIDPKTNWLVWGEVGPDGYGVTEEYDLATKPYNAGFPYFAGNNKLLTQGDGIHTTPGNENPAKPTNTAPENTGLTELPPAVPGTYNYQQACGITGPLYRYDYYPNTPYKMPPQFDGTWFVGDINKNELDTMAVDGSGNVGRFGRVFPQLRVLKPTDFKVGPDGAFYIINYAGNYGPSDATTIVRIEYTGTCRPPIKPVALRPGPKGTRNGLAFTGARLRVFAPEGAELRLEDMNGKRVVTMEVAGGAEYGVSELVRQPGLYAATLIDHASHPIGTALVLAP
jgi:cytochrome c